MDNEYVSGTGTYEHQGYIHSSLAGVVEIVQNAEEDANNKAVMLYSTRWFRKMRYAEY